MDLGENGQSASLNMECSTTCWTPSKNDDAMKLNLDWNLPFLLRLRLLLALPLEAEPTVVLPLLRNLIRTLLLSMNVWKLKTSFDRQKTMGYGPQRPRPSSVVPPESYRSRPLPCRILKPSLRPVRLRMLIPQHFLLHGLCDGF